MDRAVFETVIRDFWTYLGLSNPVFDQADAISLAVDDAEVFLKPALDDETLVVEMRVGRLSQVDTVRRTELEDLLKFNFALTLARDTLTVLEDDADATGVIFVRGFYGTAQRNYDKLSDLVSDVISAAETLQMSVADEAAGSPAVGTPGRLADRSLDADFLILEP